MDDGAVETRDLQIAQLETANRALGTENTNFQQQLEAAKEAANQIQTGYNILEDKLHVSQDEVQRLNIALSLANIREGELKQQLSTAKELKKTADRSIEISRQEVRELAAKLDTQLEEYAQYDRGLREQAKDMDNLRVMLGEARKEAEEANARAEGEALHQAHATYRVNELEGEKAKWEPILKQARDQAAQISEWVIMETAIPGKIYFRKRIVTLEIRIHNNSLYPVSIRPKDITGSLHFKAERLKEEIDPQPNEPAIIDLPPRGTETLKLQQPLRIFEAEKVQESHQLRDNDAGFWLGDLYIPISAKDTPVTVRPLPLEINHEHISLDMHTFTYYE